MARRRWAHTKSQKSSGFWIALKHVSWNYIDHTSVHGFFYLRANESRGFKRIFWWLVIILSFSFGSFILRQLIEKFSDTPFLITREKPEMLMRIPFPSVSMCHSQTVIDYQARRFIDKIKIPDGFSKADVLAMLPTALGMFTENQWGPANTSHLSTINEILELNNLSLLDVVKAVGTNCSEFVLRCSFNRKRFPCFQDVEHFTFRESMTHIGVCCSFNYNPTNLSYDPLTVDSFGVRGGLSIIATSYPHLNDGTSGVLFSDGFILLMHSPHDFPTEASSMALLEVGKITSIGIYPSISDVSASVLALPPRSRQCLTGSDVKLNSYRRATCTTRCMVQFIYDNCGCHPYFLPEVYGNQEMRKCTASDGDCFQRIYYDRKRIRCNLCLPACEQILYRMSSSTLSYNFANTSINPMYEETNLTESEFTAHIYFAGSTVPVKKTFMVMSFIDLLSNFGGVFNLVLGVSVFSILELVYYFCIKLLQHIRKHDEIVPVIITSQPTHNILL